MEKRPEIAHGVNLLIPVIPSKTIKRHTLKSCPQTPM
jgi:hypothetical protein